MKPLTIEQLKALPVGEWVYIVDLRTNYGLYIRKYKASNTTEYFVGSSHTGFRYSEYGKTWLPYKNKEQAEAKGEIIELPCKIGDTVYMIDDKIDEWEVIGILVQDMGTFLKILNKSCVCKMSGVKSVFFDKSDAEARLRELKGEK